MVKKLNLWLFSRKFGTWTRQLGVYGGILFILTACSYRGARPAYVVAAEKAYQNGEFAKAYAQISPKLQSAPPKDKLWLLLQGGAILHSAYQWKSSNELFLAALALNDTYTKSINEEVRAFFLNDGTKRYVAENFERVLIYYYLALNYIMLADLPRAYQYFKRMNDELVLIRDFDAAYKENYAARYLYALVAEALGRSEEARVQYNNLARATTSPAVQKVAQASLYALAIQEKDINDLERYRAAAALLTLYPSTGPYFAPAPTATEDGATNHPKTPKQVAKAKDVEDVEVPTILAEEWLAEEEVPASALPAQQAPPPLAYADKVRDEYSNWGSVVIIHESGLAPYKVSRGTIGDDATLKAALIGVAAAGVVSDDIRFLSYGQLLAWVLAAENPIPLFKEHQQRPATSEPQLLLTTQNILPLAPNTPNTPNPPHLSNTPPATDYALFSATPAALSLAKTLPPQHVLSPTLTTHYSQTVIQNFNDRYAKYARRHAAAIITKVALVIAASASTSAALNANSDSNVGDIVGLFINLLGGALVRDSIKPDLRSWTFALAQLRIYRVFFYPGTYTLSFQHQDEKNKTFAKLSQNEITVSAGETTFIHAYSY